MPQAQQLGRYHLLDRIAFGGMAEIFRAKTFDSRGQVHLVAVKRVLAHLVEDQDFLQMLVDEAKISALLRHENIARLYEFAKAGDEYFLAMEYVDGKDLRSLLERGRQTGRPIPPEHVAWVAMETAHALHAAHVQRDGAGRALRIVHRDVSPSNVLCSYHGEVKLCDFGIAKATLTRVQTKTGVIKGKVKYMSPEQAMGRKLDHRSDLFSLGTVMYEMLTLQAPFQAPTEIELIFAVRDARKTPVRDVTPDCPEELVRIVDKAMTRSRAARYQSGEDLALDLRIFLDKIVPGYRRSHFSRYMRKIFEDDIDRELRGMEAFEIQAAQGESSLGENLIADVLGADAPFTKFTPLYASSTQLTSMGTSNFPLIEQAQPSDLHVQPTMMIDRSKLGLPGGPDLASETEPSPKVDPEEESSPGDLHAEPTHIHVQEEPADLHAEPTRILMVPVAAQPAAAAKTEAPADEPADEPADDDDSGDLHSQGTMILFNPMTESAVTDPRDRAAVAPAQTPSTVDGYRHLVDEKLAGAKPEDSLVPTMPRGPSIHEVDTGAMPKVEATPATEQMPILSVEGAGATEEKGNTDERFPVPPTLPTDPRREAVPLADEKHGSTEKRPPVARADDPDEGSQEQTSVPLRDEDLEET
jgi:serine/threonine protein kinase